MPLNTFVTIILRNRVYSLLFTRGACSYPLFLLLLLFLTLILCKKLRGVTFLRMIHLSCKSKNVGREYYRHTSSSYWTSVKSYCFFELTKFVFIRVSVVNTGWAGIRSTTEQGMILKRIRQYQLTFCSDIINSSSKLMHAATRRTFSTILVIAYCSIAIESSNEE